MQRRGFITGAISALAAPAIVRPESLMKLWVTPKSAFLTYEELLRRVTYELKVTKMRSLLISPFVSDVLARDGWLDNPKARVSPAMME